MEETGHSKRGVKTRLLGFVLMVLGALDTLLTLRGGIPAYEYFLLILLGAAVFSIGAIRGELPPAENAQELTGKER